jgi:hypothetical protein
MSFPVFAFDGDIQKIIDCSNNHIVGHDNTGLDLHKAPCKP